jgi:uncharacterized protein (DUF58 family)
VTILLSDILLKFFSAFLTLFLAGVFLGNIILIYVSLIPLFSIIFALAFNQPRRIAVNRMKKYLTSYVDEDVKVSFQVEVPDGIGLLTVSDTLHQYFKLVEGNNFRVLWVNFKKKEKIANISYTIKCTKRGIYSLGPIKWEIRHPFLLKQTIIGFSDDPLKLIVKQRPLIIRKMRSAKTLSKIPLPLGSSAKMGIATTDFREIRDYLPGDPYRSINWKATARHAHHYKAWLPKVNEFEREGKKIVWIFLDKSANMILGSTIKNSFEYAVQAATGLAYFYLERDCKVGLCIYNSVSAEKIILPDSGKRQYYKIVKELTGLEAENEVKASTASSLRDAVRECHGHLIGSNPLSIIITTVSPKNFEAIIEGVKEIRKYTTRMRSRNRQIIVIHVTGYHIAAREYHEEVAASIMELKNQHIIRMIRKAGASVVSWNPLRQSLARLLLMGLKSS